MLQRKAHSLRRSIAESCLLIKVEEPYDPVGALTCEHRTKVFTLSFLDVEEPIAKQ